MVPQPDYGHFYKFLVSLGVLLVGLAIAAPMYVLRDTSTLMTPRSSIDALTPTGRQAVIAKQRQQRWMQDHYAVVSVPIALLGAAIAGVGMVFWAGRQKVQDDKENMDRDEQLERRLSTLGKDEVVARHEEEAVQEVEETAPEPTPQTATLTPELRSAAVRRLQKERNKAEDALATRLEAAFRSTHRVLRNAVLNDGLGGRVEADVLLVAGSPRHVSWAGEFKYVSSLKSLNNRILEGAPHAMLTASDASRVLSQPFRAVLFIVLGPEVGMLDNRIERVREIVNRNRRAGGVTLDVVVIPETSLAHLTGDHLREAIESNDPPPSDLFFLL